MSTYIRYPGTSGGVPKYATVGDLPSNASQGDLAVVLADNGLYEYDGASWVLITGSGSVITTVSDTDSIDLTVSSGDLSADLKLSAASAAAGELKITNSLENDGLLSIIDIADSTHTGALTSTDWSTFNGKQASGNYITALTGDATAAGPGSAALTLATVNSNVGSFGGATSVSAITVNAKGLVTAAASTSIQIAESQVTNLVTDLAGKVGTTLTSANIFVGNGSNVATGVAVTGDIAITNAGVTSIATGVIVNADVNASAAIAYSKLALTGSIVNADIGASAAIAGTKISPDFGSQNFVTTGSGVFGASPGIFTNEKLGVTNTFTAAATTAAAGISNVVDINGNTVISTGQHVGYFGRVSRTISSTTTDTSNSDFLAFAAQYRITPGAAAVYTYAGSGYIASGNFAMPTENGSGTASAPRIAAVLLSGGGGATFATRASHISFGALPTQGTNNSYLSDNDTFTGNWFINSTNTNESILSGHLNIAGQKELRLQDTTGGEYVGLRASGTTTTHTLTMPAAAPAVNRVLMGGGSTATDLQWGGATTTFTPAVSPAAGAYSGLTYVIQKGNYVRLGDWIMFTIQIEISAVNINTATGALNITGLPVAQKTDSGLETSFVCANSNLNTSTGKPLVTARLASAATTINLYESGDATAEAVVGADAITGGSFNKKIQISGAYPAA